MAMLDFLQPVARELPRGVSWLRGLPWPAAAALLALGVLGLSLGARHRRAVAAVGGFGAGAIAGLTLAAAALKSIAPGPVASALIGGVAVAAASLAFPWLFPFTLGAVIGAPLGARLPLDVPALGPALGAAAVGGVLVIGAKLVAASAAGLLGGAMLVAGLLALSEHIPGLGRLAAHPFVAIGLALILGVAGAAAQVEAAWGASAPAKKGRKPPLEQPKEASD